MNALDVEGPYPRAQPKLGRVGKVDSFFFVIERHNRKDGANLAWQAALALAQTIISYLPTRVRWENMSVTFSCSMYCRDKKGNGLMRQFLRMIHTGSANWSGAPSPSWHQTLLVCRY